MPTAVVIGIGGLQQAAIARAFRTAGWTVRGTSRSGGPDVIRADPESGEGLAAALAGADAVAFTLPQDHRESIGARIAASVARSAAEAGAGRIVLNVAARLSETSDSEVFRALRAARDTILSGPVPAVSLQPTVFMDNLTAPWAMPGILAGTLAYPTPPEVGIAWISHRTLAEAVVAAATHDVAGQDIAIGGPADLTGPDLTRTLAAHLGFPVTYAAIPLPGFAAGLNAAFGPPAGDRIAELYAALDAEPHMLKGGADGLARLGVTPEPFAAFVARTRWAA